VTKRTTQIVVIAAFAAILAVGVGAALAGGGLGTDRDAFLNDVAKRLDVTPAALEAALKGAYDDRIDAAVKDGKLSKEQGEAMKQRSAEGGLPLFGGGHRGGFGHRGPGGLDAAATYLGLTGAELHARLESGKSLAEIAKAEGKSVAGLEQALTAELKTKLDAAVKAGKLTQAQADEMLKQMTSRLDDMVNGTMGAGMHPGGFGHGRGGPMDRHGGGGPQQGSGSFTPVPA
jgi:polyhydroxyalkanoate synthesis regulator phasin